MKTNARILSTSDLRRHAVIESAMVLFSETGYLGTTVAQIAARAEISPAYVFRLFPTKESLFVAAVERCYQRIAEAFAKVAPGSETRSPAQVLDEMRSVYARLMSDRTVLMLQVHAQSASSLPEIRQAVHQGLASVVGVVARRSGATAKEVQNFMAFGQLCHLIVTTGLEALDESWARTLTMDMIHPE